MVLLSGKHLVGLREKLRKEGEARKKVKEGERVEEGGEILIRRGRKREGEGGGGRGKGRGSSNIDF